MSDEGPPAKRARTVVFETIRVPAAYTAVGLVFYFKEGSWIFWCLESFKCEYSASTTCKAHGEIQIQATPDCFVGEKDRRA